MTRPRLITRTPYNITHNVTGVLTRRPVVLGGNSERIDPLWEKNDGLPPTAVEIVTPIVWQIFEGLDVGGDYSTPVDSNYDSPNVFTGSIAQVVFHTGPLKLSAAQYKEYRKQLFAAAMAYQ